MKRWLVLTGLTLSLGALACAQEMTGDRVVVPAGSHPRLIKAKLSNGRITVKTHATGDVIVETGSGHSRPERTVDGLHRLNLTMNGVDVEADENTVTVRQITIGATDGSMTAVNFGLAAGDRVVVDGADRLRDGLRVNLATLDNKPAGGAADRGAPGVRDGGNATPGSRGTGTQMRNGGQNPNRAQNQGSSNSQ